MAGVFFRRSLTASMLRANSSLVQRADRAVVGLIQRKFLLPLRTLSHGQIGRSIFKAAPIKRRRSIHYRYGCMNCQKNCDF
jgi:hypothetical protein